ncbi:PREDICTED: uncharacterized protein LOC109184453 [Ipomoea nil]|uniref:uncharacterized protein LOC109184453 n=1 Tax=Ipomoea nil TaxID=35883 RepID=UPI000900E036|nr:PREDICTED: uncharacterized protein LOC109184453 [Ipomoea nil]
MAPSKKWMSFFNDRLNEHYKDGVQKFLNYAFLKTAEEHKIRCPCVKCKNSGYRSREVVEMHLYVYGISPNYTFWYHHGERRGEPQSDNEEEEHESENDEEIQELLEDIYLEYYSFDKSGSNIGTSNHIEHGEEPNEEANAFYKMLKEFEQPAYPGCNTSKLSIIVKLLYIKSIGRWSNESFDMLLQMLKDILPSGSSLPETYYDAKNIIRDLGLSYEKIDACVNNCMLYWKDDDDCSSCKICGASRWKEDINSGEIKIKSNGKKVSLKTMRYFPLKPRLQRLFMSRNIASFMRWHHDSRVDDGVMRHPADSMAWKYFDEIHKDFSLEPRNVRLSLASDGFQPFNQSKTSYSIWPVILIPYNLPPCMKDSNFILSMLIPGPEGPGDAIDIYLKPLIEELKELWEVGVDTFDASTRQNFKLHASLLWTINDFPAYENLSGWSTKGKMACPCCNKETCSMRLANCSKQCYMGHRRYLPSNHKWRKDKSSFDGTRELRPPPKSLSGSDILAQVSDLEGITLTKDDVMHIEKNICDNVLGTIMNIKGKSKDHVQARLDLEAMKIRPELHPIHKGDKLELPIASYTLSKNEKHFLCAKTLRVDELSQIESQIALTLCKLEQVFLPSFFDVMVHLPVHLANEAKIGGPFQYRWMYPIERMLYELKKLIRNMARPEGSIAEGYIAKECMTLCSRYLKNIKTKFNRLERNNDGGFHTIDA